MRAGRYPTTGAAALEEDLAKVSLPPPGQARVTVPEGELVSDFTQGGGGYGDPLDRPIAAVARDVRQRLVSERAAGLIFGVALDAQGDADPDGSEALRAEIRTARLAESRPPRAGRRLSVRDDAPALRFHETLELVENGETGVVRCRCCGRLLCRGDENYKIAALRRDRSLAELAGGPMPDGSPYRAVLREYACPGCLTLLQVDVWDSDLGGEEDLWDVQLAVRQAR
jgi:N-methylhydantoinase B